MARPKKSMIDSTDLHVGQGKPREMPSTGEAHIAPMEIEPVDGLNWQKKADTLAFFEESVEVMVHESTDKNAEVVVELWNNGRAQRFIRGIPVVVKRKFVDILARCKHTSYSQEKYQDNSGNDSIRNVPRTAVRYPFSVTQDNNPKGRDWLKKTLAEA